MTSNSFPTFIVAALFAVAIKSFYSWAGHTELQFVLLPTSKIVAWVVNQPFVYSEKQGFLFADLQLTIDKYCAGLNFFIISFLATFLALAPVYKAIRQRVLLFGSLVILCLGCTIFANVARILAAIRTNQFAYTWLRTEWFHEAQGAFVYLSILLTFYIGLLWVNKEIRSGKY